MGVADSWRAVEDSATAARPAAVSTGSGDSVSVTACAFGTPLDVAALTLLFDLALPKLHFLGRASSLSLLRTCVNAAPNRASELGGSCGKGGSLNGLPEVEDRRVTPGILLDSLCRKFGIGPSAKP